MTHLSRTGTQERPGYLFPLLALTIAAGALVYFPTFKSLLVQWLDDANYRHGLLVPVISALVFYRRWSGANDAPSGKSTLFGALVIVVSGLLLVVGSAANELFTTRLSLPTFIFGVALLFRGWAFTRRMLFPLLFLYMMVPLPYLVYYKVAVPLQLFSAAISTNVLEFFGMPVIRQGTVMHLPNYSLEVVAACSGVRSLMTMVTLSLVIGVFGEISMTKRCVLVAFAIPAAIVANTIRLIVTALGAFMVSSSFADGFLHEVSGLVVFATGFVSLIVFFFFVRKL